MDEEIGFIEAKYEYEKLLHSYRCVNFAWLRESLYLRPSGRNLI